MIRELLEELQAGVRYVNQHALDAFDLDIVRKILEHQAKVLTQLKDVIGDIERRQDPEYLTKVQKVVAVLDPYYRDWYEFSLDVPASYRASREVIYHRRLLDKVLRNLEEYVTTYSKEPKGGVGRERHVSLTDEALADIMRIITTDTAILAQPAKYQRFVAGLAALACEYLDGELVCVESAETPSTLCEQASGRWRAVINLNDGDDLKG